MREVCTCTLEYHANLIPMQDPPILTLLFVICGDGAQINYTTHQTDPPACGINPEVGVPAAAHHVRLYRHPIDL